MGRGRKPARTSNLIPAGCYMPIIGAQNGGYEPTKGPRNPTPPGQRQMELDRIQTEVLDYISRNPGLKGPSDVQEDLGSEHSRALIDLLADGDVFFSCDRFLFVSESPGICKS